MASKVVQLVAVGNVSPALIKELEDPLIQNLAVSPVNGRAPLADPRYAFNKDRNQYHSNAIMRRLVPMLSSAQPFAIGVCDVDLFEPDSQFIFGEADRESRVAVVSLYRLREGAQGEMLKRRAQVETVHQAGHLLGLSYCEDPRCVMFLASTPQECDRKNPTLCNVCRNEYGKLNR